MSERQTAAELATLRTTIHENYGFWGMDHLRGAVREALREPAPPGSPAGIDQAAQAAKSAAATVDRALAVVQKLRKAQLPEAWSGEAHDAASRLLQALERELDRCCEALQQGAKVYAEHADALSEAQPRDRRGVDSLEYAQASLDTIGLLNYDDGVMAEAHKAAMSGVDERATAADRARDAAERAEKLLRDLAGAARLSHLASSRLDPATELLIADAGGDGDADNLILTSAAADRARDAINRLSAADRKRLDQLLSQAKSPAEQAYLLKALAAGYDLDNVTAFDQSIHAHGGDERWLHDRLAPMDTSDSSDDWGYTHSDTTSLGRQWTQGPYPTCVASSNVMARAQVDPVYALWLTTDGHPDDPTFDNPDAFAARLRDEQQRVYDGGRSWWDDLTRSEGMSAGQSEDIANRNIAPHTGVEYDSRDLGNPEDRRDALGKAEASVDRGIPVPFAARQGNEGHEMLIVGHDGDRIQVYNPWGYTVWVNESDFINGHMDVIDGGVPNTPNSIRLPK